MVVHIEFVIKNNSILTLCADYLQTMKTRTLFNQNIHKSDCDKLHLEKYIVNVQCHFFVYKNCALIVL